MNGLVALLLGFGQLVCQGAPEADEVRRPPQVEVPAEEAPAEVQPDEANPAPQGDTPDEARQAQPWVLTAVGDVALTTNAFKPILEKLNHGIFAPTRELLKRGDLVFLNLETPLTSAEPVLEKTYAFTMPPERLDWLLQAGFNLFSLANNHTADAGAQGINDTIDLLEAARQTQPNLYWSGAARDPKGTFVPTLIEVKGTRVAFLAVGNNSDPMVNRLNPKRVAQAIAEVKDKVDVVILSVHFGKEYHHVPKDNTTALFRGYARAGADIILGHHPHVLRGIEIHKGSLIIYSLGNFAFSSKTVRHRETGAKLYGMIGAVHMEGGRVDRLEIHPLHVNNLEPWQIGDKRLPPANFVPQPVTGPFAAEVLDAMQEWSDAIEGNKVKIERQGDVGVVRMPR